MERCPDNILTSAQRSARAGLYTYDEVPADGFIYYNAGGRTVQYVLGEGQRFDYLTSDSFGDEGVKDPETAGPGTVVHTLDMFEDTSWFRIYSFILPNGRVFDLSAT
jgi:hypothetical protein